MEGNSKKGILFKGGKIVLPDRVVEASLAVQDGKVAGIVQDMDLSGYDVIDVTGKVLLPGAIDPHVHMWDPSPMDYREDWKHGSTCAASGGITTIVDMPLSVPPVVNKEGFQLKKEIAEEKSCVDFAFWGGLTPDCLGNMDELDALGCVAYKGFMSYANPDYPQITDGYLIEGMKKAAQFGGLIGVHAENAEIADMGSKDMVTSGEKDEALHDEARPWWVELEAIQRAVLFSKATKSKLYICHMTIAEGAEFLKEAKAEGLPVFIETCPHYLLFDRNIMREKKSFAKCNPPLRKRENVEKLWNYILDGTIDTIGSDHGPYSDEEKTKEGSFYKEYSGFGGFDAMLPGLVTEGVHNRGMSYTRLAELTSANAAKIMGLYPKKGNLLPGADADVIVLDPEKEWTFDGTKSLSKTKSEHNIYHGSKMKGKVQQTWVRGTLVYKEGELPLKEGFGEYVPKQRT